MFFLNYYKKHKTCFFSSMHIPYTLPQLTRGSGSVVSSPSGVQGSGPGQSPCRRRILVHFETLKKSGDGEFDIFCHFYNTYLESHLQV